jgi:two-component system phosphate regulon sensor histidine kinase PhoR
MLADVERLSVFVDDILEAGRIAHGRRSQSWAEVDLTQILVEAMHGIRRRYHLDEEALRLNAPARLPISTDPIAMEIILKNLLDNAVKYSPSPPRVEVEVREARPGQLEIRVRDWGIGIEQTQLKRIFKRFHRVPSVAVNERSGTGLGLYVVANLVRNLGGSIHAESAGTDLGTTQIMLLPMGVATAEATGS